MTNSENGVEYTTSSDGIDYPVLKIPENGSKDLTLEVIEYSGPAEIDTIGGYDVHHLYTRCTEIDDSKLPLEANPREPSRTAQVEAMQDTLADNPENFVKKNNGMAVLCGGVSTDSNSDPDSVTLQFNSGEGICNGGHTYFAIQTADDLSEQAGVHMEVMVLPPDLRGDKRREEITEISGARNNNNRLDNRSEADFLGYYDYFKEHIHDPKIISWHEGDSDAHEKSHIDAVHYLRLLKSLDPFAYRHPVCNDAGSAHKSLATTRSRIHSNWMDQMKSAMKDEREQKPLYYIAPHADDILYLRDMISHSLKHDSLSSGFRKTSFFQDYVSGEDRELWYDGFEHPDGFELRQTLEVLFLGLFRTDLYIMPGKKENVSYTGWYVAPEDLWDNLKIKVLDSMANYFKEVDNDPKQFIRVSAPFEQDLFTIGLRNDPPDPDILYDIESNNRYRRTDDTNEATHWLRTNTEFDELVSTVEEAPSGDPTLYVSHSGGLSIN